MFAYKSYLKIGPKESLSVVDGLGSNSVELNKCTYSFAKEADHKGQPHSAAKSGVIHLEITCLPSNPILQWAIQPRKYEDGAIFICDNEGAALEKIFFKRAACVSMSISYLQTGTAYITTNLVLSAKELTVGYTTIDNRWTNI